MVMMIHKKPKKPNAN